jgi:hypothetical protein
MTVAVAWQKGIVAAPSQAQQYSWFLRDNAGFMGLAATLLGVALFFYFAWAKVGRDPPSGVIVPLFRPPQALGPAGSRFIWKQRYDWALAAALVGSVKDCLKIAGRCVISKSPFADRNRADIGGNAPFSNPSGTTELENSTMPKSR